MEEREVYSAELINSDTDDEFQFELYRDNLVDTIIEGSGSNYELGSSSEESYTPVLKKQRRRVVESDDNDNGSTSGEEDEDDAWYDVTENENISHRINFTVAPKTVGPQVSSNVVEPTHFFKLFFTEQLVDEIINETNNYAKTMLQSKKITANSIWKTWRDVERNEFWAFVAVVLNMGTMPVANIQEYWSTKDNSRIPFFSSIFKRYRFNQIFWMLHLKTPAAAAKSRLQRASNFLEYIDSKFSEHFIPGVNICVYESILKFKGRVSFITSNPNRPTKRGIRIYVLADSQTGYVYGILPYYGSITLENLIRPDLSINCRVPLHLYQKLLNQIPTAEGYHMYTDKDYTSISLAEELMKLKCHLTGTIKTNRKGVPISIKKPKFSNKNTVAYRKENTMILAWKDKGIVNVLSTGSHAGMTSTRKTVRDGADVIIKKPDVVLNYTASVAGVDYVNQYASTYCFLRKSLKWWRKLFFWGMEICAINAYILYKTVKKANNQKPMTHLKFVKLLVDQLRGNFRQERGRDFSAPAENRLNGKLHVMRKGTKRDCVVCSKRQQKSGRRETIDYCDTCRNKPRMHMGDCFYRYHTMQDYKV
ncbi:piggyBac transposable element-derived protein 4-like [Hylaeus volcanicus]|uniref:piggyBac transposable element-derived protein 4-like n=1 Tax=Hylaeus volcanicus TaxID=313075 RepID=UPI0023B86313|nr:piggyBac transposable element-derived protein 4-like [Hylaeus volcanicus]